IGEPSLFFWRKAIVASVVHFGQTVDLNFSATAVDRVNNISYTTVERFKKNASEIYYDSGNYMRKDTSGEGGYVKIPSFCIVKEEVRDYGIIYGLYVKGIPGCEMPMVRAEEKGTEAESISKEERDRLRAQDIYSLNGLINPDTICDHTNGNGEKDVTCVWIRRTYIDNKDLSDYKNGDDTFAKNDVENEAKGMYYFESDCLSYDTSTEIGKFDEAATLEKCPLLSGIEVSEASQSTDENTGLTEASFSVTANVNRNIFLDTTKFTKVFGPSRRNVTDSYSQIRDMYTQKEEGN
ncbi:hypothetical protein IJ847_01095, partial [Candidatus Saccharibacteria bacterium]|nr:hypothetical protein [Candidatus Saccharibacteria bacterium]